MKKFITRSQSSGIKIANDGVSFYFYSSSQDDKLSEPDYQDVIVEIKEQGAGFPVPFDELLYVGNFNVDLPGVFLYHNQDSPERSDRIFEFLPGMYMVYQKSDGSFIIEQGLLAQTS